MRIGITVPEGIVTVLAIGGGGGGGAAGTICTGSGEGAAAAGGGGGGGGGALSATTCLCRRAGFGVGGGAGLAAREGATTRLLMTVLTPSTEPLSAAARAREASLSTFPFKVATPLATVT